MQYGDPLSRAHRRKRTDVVERLCPNVHGARHTDLALTRQRRHAEADDNAIVLDPVGDVAGLDVAAGTGLAPCLDMRFEVHRARAPKIGRAVDR
jgi:hypothetical protein